MADVCNVCRTLSMEGKVRQRFILQRFLICRSSAVGVFSGSQSARNCSVW